MKQIKTGISKDIKKAIEYYERSCEQNFPNAIHGLALIYEKGKENIEKNLPKMFSLFKKGAELGDHVCLAELGMCYEEGRGVEKNVPLAIENYKKACELGEFSAYYNYGNLLKENGDFDLAAHYIFLSFNTYKFGKVTFYDLLNNKKINWKQQVKKFPFFNFYFVFIYLFIFIIYFYFLFLFFIFQFYFLFYFLFYFFLFLFFIIFFLN